MDWRGRLQLLNNSPEILHLCYPSPNRRRQNPSHHRLGDPCVHSGVDWSSYACAICSLQSLVFKNDSSRYRVMPVQGSYYRVYRICQCSHHRLDLCPTPSLYAVQVENEESNQDFR